jgi:S-DNA-T family DNA segregation ATPase FtsK/SpoIIIE
VVAGHAADLWGVVLITVGVLAAFALYGDALGPAGHGVRTVTGDLLGWGRFLVPPVSVAIGVLLIAGRRDPDSGTAPPRREPARALLGGTLTLLAVAGLAALAGGSPRIGATTAALSSAGGWLGALVGDPLRSGLGGFGAATVLVALLVVAMVLFTGVSVRTAAHGVAVAGRWVFDVARGDPAERAERRHLGPELRDEPTDPFGRAVSGGGSAATGPDPDMGVVPEVALPVTAAIELGPDPVADPPAPPALPVEATRPGKGDQLEMKLGPTVGEWRLPPANLLKRLKPHAVDEREIDAAGGARGDGVAGGGV